MRFDTLTKVRVSDCKRTSAIDKLILIVMLAMSYGLQMLILKMVFKQALVMNADFAMIVFSQLLNILFWVKYRRHQILSFQSLIMFLVFLKLNWNQFSICLYRAVKLNQVLKVGVGIRYHKRYYTCASWQDMGF